MQMAAVKDALSIPCASDERFATFDKVKALERSPVMADIEIFVQFELPLTRRKRIDCFNLTYSASF